MTSEDQKRWRPRANQLWTVTAVLVSFSLGALLFSGPPASTPDEHIDEPGHAHSAGEAQDRWTCSMHPQIAALEPGSCPICGMDLIPVPRRQSSGTDTATASSRSERIALSEDAKIRAKIRTTSVKRLQSGRVDRRLLGRVDYDETRLRTVTSWIGGRMDRLHVRTTGQQVKRGQVIATLYSPEVFGAHQDLLVAREQVRKLAGATETARLGAELALDASRDRLRLLGVPAAELSTMEQANKPSEQVRIRSPFTGTILERLATEGSYVKTGTGLFQLADLSRLWVQLDAYESDLPLLSLDQEVSLKVEALPGASFRGRVTFVDPVLNQRTRTTRVRIEVKNPDGKLRPNMFAEAIVSGGDGESDRDTLVIPDTAPLFTGRRSLVYVEVPGADVPTYDARLVRLGTKMGNVYPVLAGLSEGEHVVTRGAFTLDADLQIRGGRSMMAAPDDNAEAPLEQIVDVPPEHAATLSAVVTHYLSLHEALAGDNLEGAKKASASLLLAVQALAPKSSQQFREAWNPLAAQIGAHATQLGLAKSLDEARVPFRDVSQNIATLLRIFGNPTTETLRLAFCPMALGDQGAEWLQRAATIENPYFGASMHSCGDINESVEHGTFLPLDGSQPRPAPAPAGGHQH